MMRSESTSTHILRYGSIFLGFIRILLSGYLYYQYLVSKTGQAPTKGGTLIEGVTDKITYAPYVSTKDTDRFFQNLLFKSCMSFFTDKGQVVYENDLCEVMTQDNKTFVVRIGSTGHWSDGAPVSIDDILFTYEHILQNNAWQLPDGHIYTNIVIQKLSANSVSVVFPRSSKDNFQFFTNFILPAHILREKTRERYTTKFASSPITNGCASLSSSRDENSLVFDVQECPQTWLKYYQVKKTTPEHIQKDAGIIDVYVGDEEIPGYKTGMVISNDYVNIFFNMQRGKLSIYGRKNFIALLHKYIYLPENGLPLIKEHFLFDNYPTGITDISTLTSFGSGRISILYYTQDAFHNHIATIIKNIIEQEGISEYFTFIEKNTLDEYTKALQEKDYDITIQTLSLGMKKDISGLFLTDDPVLNPSLYVNPNLATQVKDYFQSPLSVQYNIKPLIAKLYATDLPFFIIGKRTSFIYSKPSLVRDMPVTQDAATVKYRLFHSIVSVYKPQVTKDDITNRKKFIHFILSEIGL